MTTTDCDRYTYQRQILDPTKDDPKANLVLRPGDALSRPVQSTHVQSNNVLLKVTVPKRTGRKRKLGSNAPFEYEPEPEVAGPPRRTAKDLLRSLSDNPDKYQIEPVGSIENTHLFRGLLTAVVFFRRICANGLRNA